MDKYGKVRQATDDSTVHALGMLDTKGYRHTICNAYCSSTKATMVTQTHLNVSFVRTLPVVLLYVLYAFRHLAV